MKKYQIDESLVDEVIDMLESYQSFNELFENYEIELDGKWLPFGVLE